ncbi:recombination protein NinB, partial [Burkholderia vietnamiensis]|uniref:recombination protein NinB n=1 Tax=Burkholderia vietnamiensis TaxID=60552 RepID=UPI00264C23B4
KQRNALQNRLYWGAILKAIAEQAWIEGRQFDKDAWHEYFAHKFGISEELELPSGEIFLRRKSTSKMTVGEFSEYLNQIQSFAAAELGVEFC